MYDPHNDDYDTYDETPEIRYEVYDDDIYEEYDEYEDVYYDEDDYYEDEPVYADYHLHENVNAGHARNRGPVGEYPSGIIPVDYTQPEDDYNEYEPYYEDEGEFYANDRFWTRRRILIAVIVAMMVLSLLAPQLLQMIQIANDVNTFPVGPTPTALPSV